MKTYSIEWKQGGAVFIYNGGGHFVPTNMVAGYERCLQEFGYKEVRVWMRCVTCPNCEKEFLAYAEAVCEYTSTRISDDGEEVDTWEDEDE